VYCGQLCWTFCRQFSRWLYKSFCGWFGRWFVGSSVFFVGSSVGGFAGSLPGGLKVLLWEVCGWLASSCAGDFASVFVGNSVGGFEGNFTVVL